MRMPISAIVCLSILTAGSLAAQERSAGGTLDTQITWTALTTQISNLKTQLDGTTARMKQFETCGKKGKTYAPGQPGIDSDGCLAAVVATPVIPTPTVPVVKIQTAVFTETATTLPNLNTYCVNKGYDASYDGGLLQHSETRHCGGSSGGDCTSIVTTGYTVSCIRSVVQ